MSLPKKMKADLSGRIPQVYTIRSSTQRFVVFGREAENMQKIINNIGDAVKGGARFDPGNEYQDILTRYNCQFRNVAPAHYPEYFGWAIWFLRERPISGTSVLLARSRRALSLESRISLRNCFTSATAVQTILTNLPSLDFARDDKFYIIPGRGLALCRVSLQTFISNAPPLLSLSEWRRTICLRVLSALHTWA